MSACSAIYLHVCVDVHCVEACPECRQSGKLLKMPANRPRILCVLDEMPVIVIQCDSSQRKIAQASYQLFFFTCHIVQIPSQCPPSCTNASGEHLCLQLSELRLFFPKAHTDWEEEDMIMLDRKLGLRPLLAVCAVWQRSSRGRRLRLPQCSAR